MLVGNKSLNLKLILDDGSVIGIAKDGIHSTIL